MRQKSRFQIFSIRLMQVTEVTFQGSSLHYQTSRDDVKFKTYAPFDPDLVNVLRAKHIKITAEPEESDPLWMVLLVEWFPFLVLGFYIEQRLAHYSSRLRA